MGDLILITGGARSGKSTYAEKLAKNFNKDVAYIATSLPIDAEMKNRIKKHRQQRPKNWLTLETYLDIDEEILLKSSKYKVFLIDCITILITNLMFHFEGDWEKISYSKIEYIESQIYNYFYRIIDSVNKVDSHIIAVTNEIGMGIVPDNKISRIFRDITGRVNQNLARESLEVYLCVSGIPIKIKGVN